MPKATTPATPVLPAIKSSVELMTPDRADELLRFSFGKISQRHLSDRRVRALVRALENGEWKVTHQGVALDDAGVVVDGQHRLAAIHQFGKPVPIMVTTGVERDAFSVIDVGAKRTAADALHIAGFTNTNVVAAAARLVMTWKAVETDPNTTWGQAYSRVSTPQLVEFMQSSTGTTLMHCQQPANRVAMAWGRVGVRSFMTAIITLLAESDTPAALRAEYIERLIDGAYLRPTSPILALRRYMIAETGWVRNSNNVQAMRNRVGMCVVIKAYNEYLLGVDRQLMSFRENESQPRILSWYALDEDMRKELLAREKALADKEKELAI